MTKRSTSKKPNFIGDPNTIKSAFVNSNGTWLYPSFLWASCGGACGGAVVWSNEVGGVAACREGGHGGGG